MDALLPLPTELDDQTLELVEQFYANQTGPWRPEESILQLPGVKVYTTILQTDPFLDSTPGHIWGETPHTPKSAFQCQNRPRLIATLAMALFEAREVERAKNITPQEMQWRTVEAIVHLKTMCRHFLTLRDTRSLSDVAQLQTAFIHTDTLKEALDLVQRVALGLTPDDYASYTETLINRVHSYSLFARMRAAFRAYGPSEKRYSQLAVDYAIASILIKCEIERGSHQRVINRLCARERPARKPAQD